MFKPIESPNQLPQPGVANERATVDFKKELGDAAERFEPAKDVAAFANGEGGTILVGAAGNGEFVREYLPMSQAQASATQRAYEEGVRDRCHPSPIFTVDHLDYGTGKIVAVNVWPSVGQPVGVALKQDDLVRKLQGVFFYPVRIGAHTRQMLPEQMHMFVDAKFRRTVLALSGSVGSRVRLIGRETNADWWGRGQVVSVDASANALELLLDFSPTPRRITLPLDIVEAVWRDSTGWKIQIPGNIGPVEWLPSASEEYKVEELVFMEVAPGARAHGDREQRVRITNFPQQPSPILDALRALYARFRR